VWQLRRAQRTAGMAAVRAEEAGQHLAGAVGHEMVFRVRDKYGFSDEEVEFFDLHIVSDEIHGERGYQIVLEHATTVELQQRCIKICEIGAQMRLLYTTALYNDYVCAEPAMAE
jgi:pyrroloquinoline quinone (PQQ) biosynthesis protein C